MLHERSNIIASFTELLKFQEKLILHMEFGSILANQNKKTRMNTLYILKMLYTGCSTKEAISLCRRGARKSLRINVFYGYALDK